jgi:hypothetical protein
MKVLCTFLLAGVLSTSAFAPKAVLPKTSQGENSKTESCLVNLRDLYLFSSSYFAVARFMGDEKVPFFAADSAGKQNVNDLTLEEEVEILVQEETAKQKKFSKLKVGGDGADYAPWMKISEEDQKRTYQIMKEKPEARRKRQEQERSVSGNLYLDSQAQELSGTGLNSKIMNGEVELEWATSQETNTKGFIVKRRPAKTDNFKVIASYQDWGPLASKGPEGGVYRYLDTTAEPGGWVYRITECDNQGTENDICQCLVEVQTEGEQKAALVAAVGIVVLGIAAVAAGLLLDPMGGY